MAKRKVVTVYDLMQRGYRYVLTEPVGRNYHPEFVPELAPSPGLGRQLGGSEFLSRNDCAPPSC